MKRNEKFRLPRKEKKRFIKFHGWERYVLRGYIEKYMNRIDDLGKFGNYKSFADRISDRMNDVDLEGIMRFSLNGVFINEPVIAVFDETC